MSQGFGMITDHVLLRLKNQGVKLKIDFPLYQLLAKAERGIPIMSLEGDTTRRLWEFMENLFDSSSEAEDEEKQVLILDPVDGEKETLTIDMVEKKYLSIKQGDA